MRRDPVRPGALVVVALAEHQRIHPRAVGLEHAPGPRRGDHERRGVRAVESAAVPGGEVHAAGIVEALPLELVRAARLKSIAKRDDRPLSDRLEQRDRAPGRLIAPGHVDANAAALELGHRRLALGVPAQRAVEVDLRAELGQDRRGHRAAPAGRANVLSA